jgi:succinoglycan biosynthesis transport protein ExoP
MNGMFQSMGRNPRFSALSIARCVWKKKWFIAALWLLGSCATVAVVSRLAPIYTANAVVLVESQKIPENFVAATVQTALEAQLDTLKQQVLSRDRLWGLIQEFGLYSTESSRLTKDEVIQLMRRDININLSRGWSTRGPGAFQVEYEARKPEVAAEVTNRIGMFFINENVRQRTAEAAETSEFLNSQLQAAEARLREQETKLKEFKLSHNGELPEQETALLAAIGQSRTELLAIQESMGRAQQNKLILESSLEYAESNLRQRQETAQRQAELRAATPREATPTTQPLTALEGAQSELARLRARYQESHPDVQRMLQEVERLSRAEAGAGVVGRAGTGGPAGDAPRNAEATPSAAPSEEFQTERNRIQELHSQVAIVNRDIRGLEERRQRILREVAETQARIGNLPVREQQLAVITRDYDTSKTNYQSLLNKKLAADVAADMERWHKSQKFVMLDPARVPQKPTRPRRALLTGAGSLAWLALATAVAFLLELRKNSLLGEWELPSDVRVIGRIPRMQMQIP